MFSPKYNKNLTGAEITFQPEDINLYSEDPFDVQITIGNSPLEDGYYFTVKDPKLKDLTIRQLLTNYALNIEKRFELDIERYPEFLNYQEELLRYFELSEAGKLSLDIYVNKCNQAVPLDLNVSARNYLSTCVFKDQSFDYCLLDLVFDVNSSRLSSSELDLLIKEYGPIWVLFWLGNEEKIVSSEINDKVLLEKDYPVISYICESLIEANLISKSFDSKHAKYTLTNSGKNKLSAIQKEADLVIAKYAAFESVSIYPPALGVPDGFDARIQMMRRDSFDVIRGIYLMHFRLFNTELFSSSDSLKFFESGDCFNKVSSFLAKETTFSESIIDELFNLYINNNDVKK